jgi:hypothetical protein
MTDELDILLSIRRELESLSPAALHLVETSVLTTEKARRQQAARPNVAKIAEQVRDLTNDAEPIPQFFNRQERS